MQIKNYTVNNLEKRIFILICLISFSVFVFTSDGHRYTIDEHHAQQQVLRLVTMIPDPSYIQGESKVLFHTPNMNPYNYGQLCKNAILCYPTYIGHIILEYPFVWINNTFEIIKENDAKLSLNDFDDANYVFWRNSQDPNFTFLELFYGPVYASLSVGGLFLISRTFNYKLNTSISISLLFGFSTVLWAYSTTSFNVIGSLCFTLFGYLFFRKFQTNNSNFNLLLSASFFGFGFLIRPDTVLFIIPLSVIIIFGIIKKQYKIINFPIFVFPVIFSYMLYRLVIFLRVENTTTSQDIVTESTSLVTSLITVMFYKASRYTSGVIGLFLSPGAGLLIFSPILLTIGFSLYDFYKRNKSECYLFISFCVLFALQYGSMSTWHGLVSWGGRYIIPIIPFLLIMLGASIEKRSKKFIILVLIVLGGFGILINLIYVLQDVSWFVWSAPGGKIGLFGLANRLDDLYINPAIIWTFEFSQLTQSFIEIFKNFQVDVYLLKLFGHVYYGIIFISVMASLSFLLIKTFRKANKQFEIKN
jgi:hypothetical protein